MIAVGQKTYYSLATKNPVSILNLKNDRAISRDFLGSADVDYKVHGFEDLRLHVTAGIDIAKGRQDTDVDPASPQATYYGSYGWETQLKRNMQLLHTLNTTMTSMIKRRTNFRYYGWL